MDLVAAVEAVLSRLNGPWDASAAEHGGLDFKETPDTAGQSGTSARRRFRETLAETAVCFANADGGAIVVGPPRLGSARGDGQLIHSPDELTVTSPGGLLPTLRIDRLLHDTAAPRNRLLADNMARLRLAEMAGLGLDRAFREISRLGKEPPILQDGPRFRPGSTHPRHRPSTAPQLRPVTLGYRWYAKGDHLSGHHSRQR
ncbi:MAG: ATP-binding protein [Pseudonocardiales bacterium]